MNQPFRWCFIGTGKLAGIVAKDILPSGRHQIVSVYSRRLEKAQDFARAWGGRAFADAAEAISAPDVDGVYLVTPHNSHFSYASLALSLGKPVLCEKPLTVTAAEARELDRLARENQVYLAEAMWTWFSPVAWQVKHWLDAGEYGQLQRVVASYHMNSKTYAPRLLDPQLAGGALLDVGVYPITYLCRLFGKPVSVSCQGVLSGGVDLKEEVALTFPGGSTYTASISIDDFWGLERFALIGDKASTSLWFFHGASKAVLKRRGGPREVFRGQGGYLNEFDIAAQEIREGRTQSALVPLSSTLEVMEILDECRRQMGLVYPFEQPQA